MHTYRKAVRIIMTNLGNKDVFAKNLKKYMQLTGKTRNEVCQALGLKYTTFADWVNGKKYPQIKYKKQKELPPFGRSPCCSCINEKEQIMLVTITE